MERRIAVLTDVKDLTELVNGARVESARVAASLGRLSLEIELSRAGPSLRAPRLGWGRRTPAQRIRSRLALEGVQDVVVRPPTGRLPAAGALMSCDAVPGGYHLTVTAANGWQFACRLDRLEGTWTDSPRGEDG